MFDNFEITGVWSTDKNFKDYQVGTLSYKPSESLNIELTLIDSMLGFEDEFSYIYGISEGNEYITLMNCHVSGLKTSSITTAKIWSEKFIVGPKHIFESDLQDIKKVSFSFFLLNDWMKLPIWIQREEKETKEKIFKRNRFKVLEYQLNSIGAILSEGYTTTYEGDNKNIEVKSEQYYTLSFAEPQTLDNLIKRVNQIVQFFYFLFSSDLPIKILEFEFGETKFRQDLIVSNKYRVYYSQINPTPRKKIKTVHLLSYRIVSKNLESLLENWFSNYEQLETIIQTYVGDLQIQSFGETQFLNACRNIEVFHRIFLEEATVMPREIDIVRINLLETIKEESDTVQKYFSKRINHTEESTLSTRIRQSLNVIPKELLKKIINYEKKSPSKSRERFIRSCVNTRNYLTHGSTNKEDYRPLFERESLIKATAILNMTIEYFVLTKLGLNSEDIMNEFEFNSRYKMLYYQKLG